MHRTLLLPALLVSFATIAVDAQVPQPTLGRSFYPARIEDPAAVYLADFGAVGDGVADDSDALQAAIDRAQEKARFGIVFVPEGTYRLTRTLHVWKGIRLIGFGARRPTLLLGEHTPGFEEGQGRYMVHFVSDRPREGRPVRDANPGTFYSAISNIDIEIRPGNPAAIGVRSNFAQHSFLAHMDFRIGEGRAGVEEVGNEIDDCRFFGGDFGIITTKPSPSWPFFMVDTRFEGQRVAAIRTEEGGLTLVRNEFRNLPTAVMVNPGRAEELFMEDSRMEDLTGPALIISDEHNARPQFNLINVTAIRVPTLALYRDSGKSVPGPAPAYVIENFTHGNQMEGVDASPRVTTSHTLIPAQQVPPRPPTDIPPLPSQDSWVSVTDLGVVGDGATDNTEALRRAILTHATLYFPTGRYRVTDTILLREESVLIGLSPITTQLVLTDRTPAFAGAGPPKALLETPPGGTNIVTGIGLDTAGINPRAVGAIWKAGPQSMMNDVRFLGGHGTYRADGSDVPVYNETRTADGHPERDWDTQYWSLWVTQGGGGTFKDIWTPSPYAMAGLYVSDTETEGRVYAMSLEHHVRYEALIDRVANWKFYAFQFEEESAEGSWALPIRIRGSRDLRFANTYLYRVIRMKTPYPHGVIVEDSERLDFRGIHVYGPTKFSYDNTLMDLDSGAQVRSRELARLVVSGDAGRALAGPSAGTVSGRRSEAKFERVATGFEFIDGSAVDAHGNVWFVDGRRHRIYRWEHATERLVLVRDAPIAPAALAFDDAGNVIVVTSSGWRRGEVLTFHPDSSWSDLQTLKLQDQAPPPGMASLRPGHLWRDSHDFMEVATTPTGAHYLSRDGSVAIPYQEDLFRAYSLRRATPGQTFLLADEFGQKTVRFQVDPFGSLIHPQVVAEEGELDVTTGPDGHIYVAAGHVFVYESDGTLLETMSVPERPANVVFGGPDRKALYVLGRTSLWRMRPAKP